MPSGKEDSTSSASTAAGRSRLLEPLIVVEEGPDGDDAAQTEITPEVQASEVPRETTAAIHHKLPIPQETRRTLIMAHSCCASNPKFFEEAWKLALCVVGLALSYAGWGYMQELVMTTRFTPTERVPDGRFPSATFCVFANRLMALIVAVIGFRIKHGAICSSRTIDAAPPLYIYAPCAVSSSLSSWCQYASLIYTSFSFQAVMTNFKIIPVLLLGKLLKQGTTYPRALYVEVVLISISDSFFSFVTSGSDFQGATEIMGVMFILLHLVFDAFTLQWQDKIYFDYGHDNVDVFHMMFGVNIWAFCIPTLGLIASGDLSIVFEFLMANPPALQ